ncbi:hypothetical protein [Pseudomonas nitroreducens]
MRLSEGVRRIDLPVRNASVLSCVESATIRCTTCGGCAIAWDVNPEPCS